jgi:hypothetical protein
MDSGGKAAELTSRAAPRNDVWDQLWPGRWQVVGGWKSLAEEVRFVRRKEEVCDEIFNVERIERKLKEARLVCDSFLRFGIGKNGVLDDFLQYSCEYFFVFIHFQSSNNPKNLH